MRSPGLRCLMACSAAIALAGLPAASSAETASTSLSSPDSLSHFTVVGDTIYWPELSGEYDASRPETGGFFAAPVSGGKPQRLYRNPAKWQYGEWFDLQVLGSAIVMPQESLRDGASRIVRLNPVTQKMTVLSETGPRRVASGCNEVIEVADVSHDGTVLLAKAARSAPSCGVTPATDTATLVAHRLDGSTQTVWERSARSRGWLELVFGNGQPFHTGVHFEGTWLAWARPGLIELVDTTTNNPVTVIDFKTGDSQMGVRDLDDRGRLLLTWRAKGRTQIAVVAPGGSKPQIGTPIPHSKKPYGTVTYCGKGMIAYEWAEVRYSLREYWSIGNADGTKWLAIKAPSKNADPVCDGDRLIWIDHRSSRPLRTTIQSLAEIIPGGES